MQVVYPGDEGQTQQPPLTVPQAPSLPASPHALLPQLDLALLSEAALPPMPISHSQPVPSQPPLLQGRGTPLRDSSIFLSVRRNIMGIHYKSNEAQAHMKLQHLCYRP